MIELTDTDRAAITEIAHDTFIEEYIIKESYIAGMKAMAESCAVACKDSKYYDMNASAYFAAVCRTLAADNK